MKTASPSPGDLAAALRPGARTLRRGLLLGGVLRAAALALAVLLLAGFTDYFAGWESPARQVWSGLAVAVFAGLAGHAWWRGARLPLAQAAVLADRAAKHERRDIQTALDLSADGQGVDGQGTLGVFLARQTVAAAVAKLGQLPGAVFWPGGWLRKAALPLGLVLVPVVLAAVLMPRATAVIGGRLLRPAADLPPYSPWEFTLEPDPALVVFGRDLPLSVEIKGPPLRDEVRLLTRAAAGGAVVELPTFRESASRFTRRVEGVTRPLEFAFAAGRARSGWRRLEIQWQPQLEEAEVTLRPPSYAGLGASEFQLGAEELRGLRGTAVRLRARSNRPLSGGTLEGRAPQQQEVVRRVTATVPEAGGQVAEFEWRMDADLVWTLDLADVRGGRMAEPVLIAQRLLPDEKPSVEMVSPGRYAFATPETVLPLLWRVEDDFGLDKVDLIRSADGFRDRAQTLPEGPGEKRLQVRRDLPLGTLGVRPGQTLEVLLEARDRNPNLLGVSSSPATEVRIISEEDYAGMLRLRTTIEEFNARYSALRRQLEEALQALQELEKAAREGNAGAVEQARAAAARAQRQAAEWFEKFAQDFPAFATDAALSELAGQLKEELEQNASELEQAGGDPGAEAVATMARRLAERLRPGAEQLAKQQRTAEEIAAVASVLEMAAELQAAQEEQREVSEALARLSEEMALGIDKNRSQLPDLRLRQLANEERIAKVESQLPGRLQKLPEGYENLKKGAERVLDQLDLLQVGKQMGDAAGHAGQGRITRAAGDAVLARANLDQILGGSDDFCSTCRGGKPGFCNGQGMAQVALEQMLAALRGRAQNGRQGSGESAGSSGFGFGALGGSGSATAGIQLNVPLIGPPRVNLTPPQGGPGGQRQDGDNTGGAVGTTATAAESALPVSEDADSASAASWNPEDVPPKYREAVKVYFSEP